MAGRLTPPAARLNDKLANEPSSYPNVSIEQLAENITNWGFVRTHATAVRSFGLIPSLSIKPTTTTVDGKPAVGMTEPGTLIAKEIFMNTVIKFWGDRPALDGIYLDISCCWGLAGRFVMGLRDQKILLSRFELESDMIMTLTRDSS